MKKHRKLGMLAIVLVAIGLALPVNAALWVESGDAGELPGSAQVITGPSDLTGVTGSFGSAADRDMYQVRIDNPGNFQFIVSSAGAGGNGDTVMAIFDTSGIPLVFNDDISGSNFRSQIDQTSGLISSAGYYYLAIMGNGQSFMSGGNEIWENDAPFDVQKAPDGVTYTSGPLTGYLYSDADLEGSYTILFGGSVTAVPEPGFYGAAFAAMGLLVGGLHRFRSRSRAA